MAIVLPNGKVRSSICQNTENEQLDLFLENETRLAVILMKIIEKSKFNDDFLRFEKCFKQLEKERSELNLDLKLVQKIEFEYLLKSFRHLNVEMAKVIKEYSIE